MDAKTLYDQWVHTTEFERPWVLEAVETTRFKPDLVLAEPTDTPGILRLCYGPIEIGEFVADGPKNTTVEAMAQVVFSAFFDSLSAHQQLELIEAGG